MWVYQETKTNAAALVPTLPEDTAGEALAEKEAMTLVEKDPDSTEAIPSQPGLHPAGGGLSLRYADGGRPAGTVRR